MRHFKSTFLLGSVILCCMLFLMDSCGNSADKRIKQLVNEVNSQCPVNYGIGTATSFKIEGKNVIIEYSVDDDSYLLSKYDNGTLFDIWKLCCIDNGSPADKEMMNIISSSGYGIKCIFKGINSQKQKILEISNEKLKNYKALNTEEVLNTLITVNKSDLPVSRDSITTMVDCKLDKENLLYIFEVDDSNYDMSQIENDSSFKEKNKLIISDELRRNNNLTAELLKRACLSGRGFCLHHIGKTTGKVINTHFSNAELRQIANANGVN